MNTRLLPKLAVPLGLVLLVSLTTLASCLQTRSAERPQTLPTGNTTARQTAASGAVGTELGSQAHYDRVMSSAFCSTCHPAIYAEHELNTHGRAYSDQEVRMATGNFRTSDCIRCHTPRPIFETGLTNNPQRRHYGLEDGNSCMTCHWQQDTDYAQFVGGADCKTSFDPRAGDVEACSTCHKNHGTPYQWEKSPNGKIAGRTCITCHMERVERPVAVGGPVRRVYSHRFPGARDEKQVRKAYTYEASIEGNEAVVVIANSGAGHNFPTELRQRSVESLVVVRDPEGNEVARSRRVFRDPYKRPYGMQLQTNTQIPSGEERVHRVPIGAANGTVTCELHYKFYFPIEDNHPDLARRLERRELVFADIEPNTAEVKTDGYVTITTPENIGPEAASVSDSPELSAAPLATAKFEIPEGNTEKDIDELVGLFNFQMPEANRKAMARLVDIGAPAVPRLIKALGFWDNKTFNKSMTTLRRIGRPAVPLLREALTNDNLYVRIHARMLLGDLPLPADKDKLIEQVVEGLQRKNALDRKTTATLLARLLARDQAPAVARLLTEFDPDVVRAAAFALAELGHRDSVPAIEAALHRHTFVEMKIDLATALARLGSSAGITGLLALLDYDDELIREKAFEAFYQATHLHMGYEVTAPRPLRLDAIGRLQAWWAKGDTRETFAPKSWPYPDPTVDRDAFHLVKRLGGGTGLIPAIENDQDAIDRILADGTDALPALIRGLKFPPGFASKRASILAAMQRLGDRRAAAFVLPVLRDPVFGVAQWGAATLEQVGDADCLPALRRFEARVRQAAQNGKLPDSIPGPDPLIASSARTRLMLGDEDARVDLVALLHSDNATARRNAINALADKFGDRRGYDPDAPAIERLRAAASWAE
ncbi:MAG: HEAT repeat domain-containing protein [Planctomycetota bacterium]